jgi:c-di-GMP-binding flagellar brake protein YcgR
MIAFPRLEHAPGGQMADGSDRREARRFTMTLPMRLLPRGPEQSELKAQTRDISYRGLYFLSESRFEIGGEIDFVLTLPQGFSQGGAVNIRCRGQIIRVEPTENGRVGVAARIERYDFQPATASAA